MNATEAVASATLNSVSRVSGRLAGAGAFSLFHMPLARSGMRATERELFAGAQVGQVDVNGKSAATYRWGDGERPVLLVHGWQSRGSRFADFVPGLLDQGHSVVTFDAPGHGDSGGRSTTILEYREIITRLHDQYGTFDALVAHSLGALASFYAMTNGVKARKVVTISGVCDFSYLTDEFCTALKLRDRLKARLQDRIGTKLFPHVPADRTPFSVTHAAEDVRSPVLVVHDEDDTRIEVAQGHRLAGAFGDRARLVTTSGLGHRRILGDPEVVRTVLDFVGRSELRPSDPAHEPLVAD
ncbi:alpha/beta fold hydrolase [Streptomyces sp. DT24]|uniref:alpha/beta fold hydrolase n=1 Tax=unclassified Streptomyces TaxID=2593676 RepID=UPI0023B92632|nr:alpha/beta hydrolase [Streptomyces sp. AM 4-1-1]WEH32291.1 alpha/beta hydrolase [Streptomyces sp. AM 4-1-1]